MTLVTEPNGHVRTFALGSAWQTLAMLDPFQRCTTPSFRLARVAWVIKRLQEGTL